MEPVEIRTDRLLLRAFGPADTSDLVTLCADPEIPRWTTLPTPYTQQDAISWTGTVAPELWAAGNGAPFALVEASTGRLVGSCGLHRIAAGEAEIGYWCAREARGKGLVSEAVHAITRWGFETLGLERIAWYAGVGNWGSRRVAERSGYTIEGMLRKGRSQRGERGDCWVGGRLASDPGADTRRLPSYSPLTDGVVTLRPWRLDDADDVRRACDDPMTVRFLPVPSPYTFEDGVFYVGTLVPLHWAEGLAANVAVTDAASGALLGAVGLKLELRQHGVGEVGYWTAPWARGRGAAGRAAALHARWGLDVLGLNRVELLADVENHASQRAAEKGGFLHEGISRRARPDRTGEARDMVLYALVGG